MNAPKVTDLDYIDFLVAAPRVVSCTEAAQSHPPGPQRAAHDAFTRLLHRLDPDPTPLWEEAQEQIDFTRGVLIIDDTTLDKPYAHQIRPRPSPLVRQASSRRLRHQPGHAPME